MTRWLALANAIGLLLAAAAVYAQSVPADLEYDINIFADPADAFEPEPPSRERAEEIGYPPAPALPGNQPMAAASASPLPPVRSAMPATGEEPRLVPCVSREEYNRAVMGSGCDCSCQGYARISDLAPPEQRRCMVVCGMGYHACWAPPPTDAEIASFASTLDGGKLPSFREHPTLRDTLTAAMMLNRATDWRDRQMCTR